MLIIVIDRRISTFEALDNVSMSSDEELEFSIDDAWITMFAKTFGNLEELLPLSTDIKEAFANGTGEDQHFIQELALFIGKFLTVSIYLWWGPFLNIIIHK